MIEVSDVHKSFKSGDRWVEVLRGVSCRIPKGRFAFIVGPSGSGKSTLLYLMGALDRPTSGTISVEGHDLTADVRGRAERLSPRPGRLHLPVVQPDQEPLGPPERGGPVPARPASPPSIAGRPPTCSRRSASGDRLDHRPWQLSGGEQQRVAIARALIKDPVVVLADEPTGELDRKTGDEIYKILRRLQAERQTTLVVVTHDRRFIRPDDLVLEIEDGLLKASEGSESEDDLTEAEVR